VLDLAAISRLAADEKDLEILLLRQQLRIVERKQTRGPLIPRWQKVPLAAMSVRLKETTTHARKKLEECVRLFKPDTLMGWHRDLVRLKWTFKQGRKPGRPPIDGELERWIIRVALDNPGLGYEKLEGEMRKLGFEVSAITIRTYCAGMGFRQRQNGHAAHGAASLTTTRSSSWHATFLP
jgi:hypothetical protein